MQGDRTGGRCINGSLRLFERDRRAGEPADARINHRAALTQAVDVKSADPNETMVAPIRVIASPGPETGKANRYITLLYQALSNHGVHAVDHAPKRLLLERGDILHVHWPDRALAARTPLWLAARLAVTFVPICGRDWSGGRSCGLCTTIHRTTRSGGAAARWSTEPCSRCAAVWSCTIARRSCACARDTGHP